jgi:hypothetical protein
MAINTSGKTVGLSIQPASDLNPGLLNRITGANKVLVTAPDGKSVIQVDPSTIISGGGGGSGTAIPAVDFVLTSNDSLSGLAARDGFTPIDGSRALATGQTTLSQNGLWLVQSGAWTRPTDYNSDAQVAAAIGATVYVKSGTLGGDSSFYQKSGTTLAGSKVFAKSADKITKIRAVQTLAMFDSGTIYGSPWVYNGTDTWTAPANGALPSPWIIFDNITTPTVGDLVEVNNTFNVPGATNTACGIFAIASLGSAGTKATLVRPPQLNSSAAYSAGVAYEVLDGKTLKNTRRQMLNQGAVVLNTTQLFFGPVSSQPVIYVDLAKQYGVRDFPDLASWTSAGQVDYFRALDKFFWDYRYTPALGVLPSSNGGQIIGIEPFDCYGTSTLQGAGQNITQLFWNAAGGHMITAQTLADNAVKDGFPQIGPTVDTWSSGADHATSLSTNINGAGETNRQFFYVLTDAGVIIDKSYSQFECRMLIDFTDFTPNPSGHTISCRGRRLSEDLTDYTASNYDGCAFAIINASYAGQKVTATLRTTDTTAGVYGAAVHTGGGTGTIAGDSLIMPTEDAPNFTWEVMTGGTVGTAGITLRYAVDGGTAGGNRKCAEIALGTAAAVAFVRWDQRLPAAQLASTINIASLSGEQTIDGVLTSNSRVVLAGQTTSSQNGVWVTGSGAWTRATDYNSDATIAAALFWGVPVYAGATHAGYGFILAAGTTLAGNKTLRRCLMLGSEVNGYDQSFSACVQLAGTLTIGDTYKIPCSGVNTSYALTSDTVCLINTPYDICLQVRGGRAYLYCSVAGGSVDASASATTGIAVKGMIRQRYWENVVMGRPQNAGMGVSSVDFNEWNGHFGGIRFKASNVSALSSTVTTLYDDGVASIAGSKFCWVPNTKDVRYDVGGTLRRHYQATTEVGRSLAWVTPRSLVTGAQFAEGGLKGLTLASGTDASNRASGALFVAWRGRVLDDVRVSGGNKGFCVMGPDFGSTFNDMTWSTKFGDALEFFQGQVNLSGRQNWNFLNGPRWASISTALFHASGLVFGNTDYCTAGFHISNCLGGEIYTTIDAENQIQHSEAGRELMRVSVADGATLKVRGQLFGAENYSLITQVGGGGSNGNVLLENLQLTTNARYPAFSCVSNPPPFVVGGGVTNNSSAILPMCDTLNKWSVNGVAGVTDLANADATIAFAKGIIWHVPVNTWGANRTLTFSTTGMQTGDTVGILVESQATYTTTLVGPGFSMTIPASTDRFVELRLNEKRQLVRMA